MEAIEKELVSFIRENIIANEIDLTSESSLKDVGVDSFSIVEIVLFVERKYGQLIPDHLMVPETFSSVSSIAQVIHELQSEKA